jgi:RNA polymerase sigma factor (sigma-70 family)
MDDANYLAKKYELLPEDELNALARRMRVGDKNARELLILHNIRLVVHFAKVYMNSENMEDLTSEGMVGLIHAVDKYDPDLGYKFSTYATWWIRQALQREVYRSSPLHLAQHDHEALPALRKAVEQNTHDRDHHLLKYIHMTFPSLDRIVNTKNDEKLTLGQMLRDSHDEYAAIDEQSEIAYRLERLLVALDKNERELIELHYGLGGRTPLSIREIALQRGISRQAIDVQFGRAMRKLRADPVKRAHNRKERAS